MWWILSRPSMNLAPMPHAGTWSRNASPWDNMKFDLEGIKEVQRKFFGTLFNTYQFFALYANVDGFAFKEKYIPLAERPEIDRWILSSLNSLAAKVKASLDDYEPTQAGRSIEEFVESNSATGMYAFAAVDSGKENMSTTRSALIRHCMSVWRRSAC